MPLYSIPTGKGVGSLDTDLIRTLELDGVAYDLRFRWNTRDESWTLICNLSGAEQIFSTKACAGRVLNAPYKYRENCPQGELIIVDLSESSGRVDFNDFTIDGRFRLLYNSIT
jgi:hypothetical protein